MLVAKKPQKPHFCHLNNAIERMRLKTQRTANTGKVQLGAVGKNSLRVSLPKRYVNAVKELATIINTNQEVRQP